MREALRTVGDIVMRVQYDPSVVRAIRIISALMLAFAVGGVPMIADWCASSCEAARHSGAPSRHHASASSARIGRAPRPWGRDHEPVVVDAATSTKSVTHTFATSAGLPGIVGCATPGAAAAAKQAAQPDRAPPPALPI